MVVRVLEALRDATVVGTITVVGPHAHHLESSPVLQRALEESSVRWMGPATSPSASVRAALESLPGHQPVLVTTADHALLTPEMVEHYCREARLAGTDLTVGVTPSAQVLAAYPKTRRTTYAMKDGRYCGCNLFAFLTPRALSATDVWREVESRRKHPWRLARFFGLRFLLGLALKRYTMAEAIKRVAARMNLTAAPVIMPFPDAAVDVDTVEDWELVRAVVEGIRPGGKPRDPR
jgi:2-phospho-L-lactate guanylyltransferase (CobY/MobA/RfbA family)